MAIAVEVLYGWTIYCRPADFPQHWCVRMWMATEEGQVIMHGLAVLCDSLDEAREQIPEGAICVPRDEDDDPVIYETWL